MVEVGDAPLHRQAQSNADQLEWQQHQRHGYKGEDNEEDADHRQAGGWRRPDRRALFLARSGPDRKLAKGMIPSGQPALDPTGLANARPKRSPQKNAVPVRRGD